MKYHENREGARMPYYCDCGKVVSRKVVGFGPSTTIIVVDQSGKEECE